MDRAEDCHAGSVLSCLPLKKTDAQRRLLKDAFRLTDERISLADFCRQQHIQFPRPPIRFMLRPASPEESGYFFAQPPEKDADMGAIGHVRIDFGRSGTEFWHTWWPRGPQELNTPKFKDELGTVVDDLRKGVLKDLPSMRRFCDGSRGAIEGGVCYQNYGFVLETERYIYRLRCNPVQGDYQAYLSCFDKHAQKLEYSLTEGRRQMLLEAANSDKPEQAYGLTKKGRQMLLDAADPGKPHSYGWYVIENINNPERRIDHTLPLEEAVQMYVSLDCEDKRMGVTKDDIASVDLAIRLNGREWLPEDYRKSACFAQDPVVAGAVTQLQQAMESQTHDQSMAMGGMPFG